MTWLQRYRWRKGRCQHCGHLLKRDGRCDFGCHKRPPAPITPPANP